MGHSWPQGSSTAVGGRAKAHRRTSIGVATPGFPLRFSLLIKIRAGEGFEAKTKTTSARVGIKSIQAGHQS